MDVRFFAVAACMFLYAGCTSQDYSASNSTSSEQTVPSVVDNSAEENYAECPIPHAQFEQTAYFKSGSIVKIYCTWDGSKQMFFADQYGHSLKVIAEYYKLEDYEYLQDEDITRCSKIKIGDEEFVLCDPMTGFEHKRKSVGA